MAVRVRLAHLQYRSIANQEKAHRNKQRRCSSRQSHHHRSAEIGDRVFCMRPNVVRVMAFAGSQPRVARPMTQPMNASLAVRRCTCLVPVTLSVHARSEADRLAPVRLMFAATLGIRFRCIAIFPPLLAKEVVDSVAHRRWTCAEGDKREATSKCHASDPAIPFGQFPRTAAMERCASSCKADTSSELVPSHAANAAPPMTSAKVHVPLSISGPFTPMFPHTRVHYASVHS